jgi:hypothetical protein
MYVHTSSASEERAASRTRLSREPQNLSRDIDDDDDDDDDDDVASRALLGEAVPHDRWAGRPPL